MRAYRYPDELTIGLLVAGGLFVLVGGLFAIAEEHYGSGLEESGVLLFVLAGLVLGGLGLLLVLLGRSQYFWMGSTDFGFRSSWPFDDVDVQFKIRDYAGLNWREPSPAIELGNGESMEIPSAMIVPLHRIEGNLAARCNFLRQQEGFPPLFVSAHDSYHPPAPWPPAFTFEDRGAVEPAREETEHIKIDDPDALRSLIRQYRAAAIFRESFPPAFDLVKIFIGLKRSNGGLILIGVHPGGEVVGIPEGEIGMAQERLAHLAGNLTQARVEIGRVEIDGKVALFAVFNATEFNTRPLDSFDEVTSNVATV